MSTWTILRSDTIDSHKKKGTFNKRKVEKFISTVETKSLDDLKKDSELHYQNEMIRQDNLVEALENNRLKSERLQTEAHGIKNKREKEQKRKDKTLSNDK